MARDEAENRAVNAQASTEKLQKENKQLIAIIERKTAELKESKSESKLYIQTKLHCPFTRTGPN